MGNRNDIQFQIFGDERVEKDDGEGAVRREEGGGWPIMRWIQTQQDLYSMGTIPQKTMFVFPHLFL